MAIVLRFACVMFLFVIACLLSGAFGAFHNQISYTVSAEYFTKFKFEQFTIAPSQWNRVGAAIVGWQTSWWMGVVIGMFLIPFGLLIRNTKSYFFWMLRVFGLVLATTLMTGLAALAISCVTITPATTEELTFRGNSIDNVSAFFRAGMLHRGSYLGGFVGIFVGMVSILKRFLLTETGSAKIVK